MILDYTKAIKKVNREEWKGNNPIPDILGFQHLKSLYEDKLSEILNNLFYDYNKGVRNPSPLLRIDVPKPNFTIRPMSRPENKDWILFEALVNSIASRMVLKEHICKRSYSFKNSLPETESDNNWIKFDDKCRELYTIGFKYAVTADLTGYYENISLAELKKRLNNYLDSDKDTDLIIDVLFKMLNTWSDERVSGYGLPQGPPASSFLADIYLDLVDSKMEKYKNYYRYMDDFRIFCQTEIEAKKALKDLIIALREIKLNINAKKTKILHDNEISSTLLDPQKPILNTIEAIIKGKKREQIVKIVPSLQNIFENAFIDDIFEKSHLNFSLYRLSKLQSSGINLDTNKIVSLILKNIISKPHHTGLFCFFLTLFPSEIKIAENLIVFLQSEHNIYDWQEVKILQSLLSFNGNLDPTAIKFFISSAKDSNKNYAARAFYFLLVGKHGNNRDRELVVDCYWDIRISFIKVAITLAVQELGKDSRNAFYSKVRKYENDDEIAKFVDYVKSLKSPIYYLDKPRPTIEGLEDFEPSLY